MDRREFPAAAEGSRFYESQSAFEEGSNVSERGIVRAEAGSISRATSSVAISRFSVDATTIPEKSEAHWSDFKIESRSGKDREISAAGVEIGTRKTVRENRGLRNSHERSASVMGEVTSEPDKNRHQISGRLNETEAKIQSTWQTANPVVDREKILFPLLYGKTEGKDRLEQIDSRKSEMENIKKELVKTERDFINNLKVFTDVIKEVRKHDKSLSKPNQYLEEMIENYEDVVSQSEKLVAKFEEGDFTCSNYHEYASSIGKIIQSYDKYSLIAESIQDLINRKKKKNKNFKEKIENILQEKNIQSLNNLVSIPFQRPPRIEMLFESLVKKSTSPAERFSFQTTLDLIKRENLLADKTA